MVHLHCLPNLAQESPSCSRRPGCARQLCIPSFHELETELVGLRKLGRPWPASGEGFCRQQTSVSHRDSRGAGTPGPTRLPTSLGFTGGAAQRPWSPLHCWTDGPPNILSALGFFSATALCAASLKPAPWTGSIQQQALISWPCPPSRLGPQPGGPRAPSSTARPSAASVAAPYGPSPPASPRLQGSPAWSPLSPSPSLLGYIPRFSTAAVFTGFSKDLELNSSFRC